VKFALIEAEKADFPVAFMCRQLGVSRSGYYVWQGRLPSNRSVETAQLGNEVKAVYHENKGRYGSPRVLRELKARGRCTSRKRVARIMHDQGLFARQRKRCRRTTDSHHPFPIANNLLERNFETSAPNMVWVTDLTYIWTGEGWLYLAAILDLYSRAVVGWAMSDRIDTMLCLKALDMAVTSRRPPPGLVHHSDRGSQYASHDYREALKKHGMVCSMSRRGDCWDNAVAESFWGTLKNELADEMDFASRGEARRVIFEYIETYYNLRRRHSSIAYRSPLEHERLYRATVEAP
jgi:transposase InsO family protein